MCKHAINLCYGEYHKKCCDIGRVYQQQHTDNMTFSEKEAIFQILPLFHEIIYRQIFIEVSLAVNAYDGRYNTKL